MSGRADTLPGLHPQPRRRHPALHALLGALHGLVAAESEEPPELAGTLDSWDFDGIYPWKMVILIDFDGIFRFSHEKLWFLWFFSGIYWFTH